MNFRSIIGSFLLCLSYNVYADPLDFLNCPKDSPLYEKRSEELQNLAKADQDDRSNWNQKTPEEITEVVRNDLKRRKRVALIFAEGCFHAAKDYMAAALIYQHGETPDHYYQTFIWSLRAADLGESTGKSWSSLAIDRYLIAIGKKQLFGTQGHKLLSEPCYCMVPVEPSFPDDFRKEYSGRSLEDNYALMMSMNDPSCPKVECALTLQPTPKGSIIGLW